MKDIQIKYSAFTSEKDNQPRGKTCNWQQFAQKLKTIPTRTSKSGAPAYSGARYAPGTKRSKSNVSRINLIVLDFDAGNPDEVVNTLIAEGHEAVVVSSWSYTAEAPKFRVVCPPSRPIQAAEWASVYRAMTILFPDMIDATCKDPSHIYYYPAKPTDAADTFYHHVEGEAVDVDALLEVEGPECPMKKKRSIATIDPDKITARMIAEHTFNKVAGGQLWFYHQLFRIYEDGYWKAIPLDDEPLIAKEMLDTFKDASINQIDEAMRCLQLMATAQLPDQSCSQHLICLNNGTLDPLTGQLMGHDSELRLMFKLPIDWNPEATIPRLLTFLHEVWGHEPDFPERLEFLQQWFGYLLMPSCKHEKFLWLEGLGGNGKSVLLKIMAAYVGEENTNYAQLERLDRSAVRAELEGKKLNISGEMTANTTLSDGYLKQLTSGEPIEADRKYKASVTFIPTVKLVASTNKLPRLLDTSDGFGRRAVILSFSRQFDEDSKDIDLADTIISHELEGVLAWGVEGLRKLEQQRGFTIPPSSKAIVKTYMIESDAVALFNLDALEPSATGTPVKDLFKAFSNWCQESRFQPCNIAQFGTRLRRVGVDKRESNGVTYRLARLKAAGYRQVSVDKVIEYDDN